MSGQEHRRSKERWKELPINSLRLLRSIEEFGRIGRDRDGSINRICLTPVERAAHDQMAEWMREAGLRVERDAYGNTVGVRLGRAAHGSIAIGSHADSVPKGGNYDGAVGVMAALEVVRALNDAEVETELGIKVVCFSSEEGARFGRPCLGSTAAVGLLKPGDLHDLRDSNGVSLHDALVSCGRSPQEALQPAPWVADVGTFLELHIEQGRVLEDAGEEIGVVDWIAGNRRLRMRLTGVTDHSGGTPMRLRRDALVAAAEVALEMNRLANQARGLVGTVGEFKVTPSAMTAVPGQVDLSVDVRSTDVVLQERTIRAVIAAAETAARRRDVDLEIQDVSSVAPIFLPSWLRQAVADVGRRITGRARIMTSGPGHDAAIMARRVHSSVIFIPCRRGISHSPEEWASPDHLTIGTRVLARALLEADRLIAAFAPSNGGKTRQATTGAS